MHPSMSSPRAEEGVGHEVGDFDIIFFLLKKLLKSPPPGKEKMVKRMVYFISAFCN